MPTSCKDPSRPPQRLRPPPPPPPRRNSFVFFQPRSHALRPPSIYILAQNIDTISVTSRRRSSFFFLFSQPCSLTPTFHAPQQPKRSPQVLHVRSPRTQAKQVQLTSSARILVLELRDVLDYALVLLEPPPPEPEALRGGGAGLGSPGSDDEQDLQV